MYLKKIRLLGFKSFCDPQLLELPTAISAVVGPNGCGKSNIIDAVKCLTGQSKAREMRGEHISDLIFNGSDQRSAVGQAQVELVFDNRDQILKGPFAHYKEVAVKRLIGRDGHSTFFINQTRCRRKDVIDLFTGTGLGPKSYAIIEQGMIARFIEAKPAEVRAYIEEVAGISRYKERRKETLSQLESSADNLSRLADLKSEMSRQVAHLAEQAEEAQRYQELKQQLLHYRQQNTAYQYQQAQRELINAQKELSEAQFAYEERAGTLRQVLQGFAAQEQEHDKAQEALQQLQQSQHQLQLILEQKKSQWQQARQRRQFLEEDCAQWEEQIKQLDEHRQQLESSWGGDTLPWQDLEMELVQKAATLKKCQEEHTGLSESYQKEQHQAQSLKEESQKLRTQQAQQQLRLEHQMSECRRLQRSAEAAADSLKQLEQEVAHCDLTQLQEKAEVSTADLHKAQQALHSQKEKESELQSIIAQAKWQLEQLRTPIVQAQQSQEKAAKRLKARKQESLPWLGFTQATELGSHDYPQELQEHLSALATAAIYHGIDRPPQDCWQSIAERDCEYVWGADNSPSYWQHILPCASWEEADQRQSSLKSYEALLLPGGCLLGPNWIRPQRHRAEALLTDLEEQAQSTAQLYDDLWAQQEAAQAALHQAQSQKKEQLEKLTQAQKALTAAQHQAQIDQHALIRAQQRLSDLTERCTEKKQIMIDSQQRAEELTDSIAELEKSGHQLAQEVVRASERSEEQQQLSHKAYEQYQQAHSHYEKALQQHHQVESEIQRLKMQRQQEQQQFEQHGKQREKAAALLADKRTQWQQSATPIERLEEEMADDLNIQEMGNRRVHEQQEALAQMQKDLDQHHKNQRAAGSEKDKAGAAVTQAQMNLEKQQIHQTHLEESILDQGWTVPQIAELSCDMPWDEVKQSVASCQKAFEALGPVNLRAISEHQQQSQRLEELSGQCADLEHATAQIEQALKDLDLEMHTLFHETFSQLQQNFQQLFPTLFGGGRAELILTEAAEGQEPGVVIKAQPPGKKNASLSLLSGGEKALTAAALLFAFFQLNPAPFCLLDEIDAPLDDANTARLGHMIQSLSSKTQFIIVTHSKVMMEYAGALYGVTMKEPGVSRLVSVSLDEALEVVGEP